MKIPRAAVVACTVAVAALAPRGARAQAATELAPGCAGAVEKVGAAMGTRVRVHICPARPGASGEREARDATVAAFAEVERLEGLWTTWRPTSEVSRLNAAAGLGPVTLSPETFEILERARAGSIASGGLFDVTFAPLGEVWRFDTPPESHSPVRLEHVPSEAEVAERLARVGWRGLRLDPKARTAMLERPGMAVHLGGIGKGAAVDRVVRLLRARGFASFAVQAGGDLYCAGKNGARPWRVGIAHPRRRGAILGSVEVTDAAFSTSGDYERFAIVDGKRYHHILDTRTGFPATASQSATVLAPTATDAEILTKTAFILGGAEGLRALERAGARGVLVDAGGRVWASEHLKMETP